MYESRRVKGLHEVVCEVKIMEILLGWPINEWRILLAKHKIRYWDKLPSELLADPELQKPDKNEAWKVLMDKRVRSAFEKVGLKYPSLDDLYTQIEIEFSRSK